MRSNALIRSLEGLNTSVGTEAGADISFGGASSTLAGDAGTELAADDVAVAGVDPGYDSFRMVITSDGCRQ